MAKNRLDYQAQLSRHSHNISAGYTASITTGPIVPQYFHILGPGDTIYYQNRLFARLQDVVTAFLGEIDIHVDSFLFLYRCCTLRLVSSLLRRMI